MASRTSPDARMVNQPRLIAGVPYDIVIGLTVFAAFAALSLHNWYLLPIVLVGLMFLSGAGKKDANFLAVYFKHRAQAGRYTPVPVSMPPQRMRRPVGYGRYDAQ